MKSFTVGLTVKLYSDGVASIVPDLTTRVNTFEPVDPESVCPYGMLCWLPLAKEDPLTDQPNGPVNDGRTLRIGVLGAARIARNALLAPAHDIQDVLVTVVGAREPARAREFASRHGISSAVAGYESVLRHPEVDAVYIPLPNGLHAEWAIKAVQAGKPVLSEKPFTANEMQARRVAEAAAASRVPVMQAFHYRYHPFFGQLRDVIRSGELGTLRSIEITLCAPIPPGKDIRWDFGLAGGSMMDLGSYAAHMARHLSGEEPAVVSAQAKTVRDSRLDRWTRAELAFPSGYRGTLTVGMWSARFLQLSLKVIGERGSMRVLNPLMPQVLGRASIRTDGGTRHLRAAKRSSYSYQLESFRDAVLHGGPVLTDGPDAVATMKMIDDVYLAAGLPLRPGE